MDRATRQRGSVSERVGDRVGAWEGRQQRRMRVEDPSAEGLQDRGADDPHVAGQHDGVDAHGYQRFGEGRVVTARHERGLDPLFRRPVERRTGAIGEDERDLAAELASSGRRGEGSQVRAGA